MKIVFMGTPDFAVPTLEKLCEAGHEVGFAVTQPDTARDRGKKIKYTPVKEKALQLGIEVLQPEKIKNNAGFMDKIKEYGPDVTVVVAYGKLLPKELLDIPAKGCINVHASLLPRHRGAAPIQRAIIDGDEKTGVTIMYMAEGLDTGDMLAAAETPVDRKNAGQLHDELSVMGAELLTKTLEKVEAGTAHAKTGRQQAYICTYDIQKRRADRFRQECCRYRKTDTRVGPVARGIYLLQRRHVQDLESRHRIRKQRDAGRNDHRCIR